MNKENNMTKEEENSVVMQIHPLLLEEFKYLKDKIEEESGYEIEMSEVSKIIAMQIKEKMKEIKKKKIRK